MKGTTMKTRERKTKKATTKQSRKPDAAWIAAQADAGFYDATLEAVCVCGHKRLFHTNDTTCENCPCRLFQRPAIVTPTPKPDAGRTNAWNTGRDGFANGYGYNARKSCQHNGTDAFTTYTNGNGTVRLCGAKALTLNESGAALVVDCSGTYKAKPSRFVSSLPKLPGFDADTFDAFNFVPVPVLSLNWTDNACPSVQFGFWSALFERLPSGRVVVCCIGSHGRTGTFLALCLVWQGLNARDAIDTVRTVHCSEAIETREQEKYIEAYSDSLNRPK